jgi:hypothetical protein
MAICYTWLLEHLLPNLVVICVTILFDLYIRVPEPTPSSLLMPSVSARTVGSLVPSSSMIIAPSAECGQFFYSTT